jgi:hypothetical protein
VSECDREALEKNGEVKSHLGMYKKIVIIIFKASSRTGRAVPCEAITSVARSFACI